jgi:thymidine kinase
MTRVFFRYGPMNAGKSAHLLMVRHNYIERGQRVLIFKPAIDTRAGERAIWTRMGLEAQADAVLMPDSDLKAVYSILVATLGPVDCVLVDEAQFLTPRQVEDLCRIADEQQIPVMAFGLRADFRGDLFPGSAALFAMADRIEEMKTICWCGRKATMNARLIDGKTSKEGPQVQVGGNESYISLCRRHWREGRVSSAV